jgi:phosphoribosylformylglycinamidine cyclo-ligase
MGIGMIVAVNKDDVEATMSAIKETDNECYVVGSIVDGEKGIELC